MLAKRAGFACAFQLPRKPLGASALLAGMPRGPAREAGEFGIQRNSGAPVFPAAVMVASQVKTSGASEQSCAAGVDRFELWA